MNLLATLIGWMPVSIDVAGRKTRAVLQWGDRLVSASALKGVRLGKASVDIPEGSLLRLWVYAGKNVRRTYSHSDLGQYMQAHLQPGNRFVDIGANIGGYSLLAANRGAEVIAFEPHPELGGDLESISRAFGELRRCALADQAGEVEFNISDENPGGSSLVTSEKGWEASGYSRKVHVPVSVFDDEFSAEIQVGSTFDLVKIDVEGAEASVVRGMYEALGAGIVQAIWCEVRGPASDRNPNSYREVMELLAAHGYQPFRYSAGKEIPFNPQDSDLPQYFDLLFRKP